MIKLTILFEEPFWIGVFEKYENSMLQVSRVVFGEEPKDYEVYDFILKNFYKLKFGCPVIIDGFSEKKINSKRMRRKINEALEAHGVGTKAQQAIKLDYEKRKIEKKVKSKEKRELLEREKFEKKIQKKKQKKRGH